jgi:cellulose synthase/poly-beta-1,6-N-acetylglucosamine synthase-like glycosyltransferase
MSSDAVLRRTLGSILSQTFDPTQVQVVVVDDASEPPLEGAVCEFAGSFAGDTVYIRNRQNFGRAATRNRGIAATRGEILVFLDVDQLLHPQFLSAMDRAFADGVRKSVRANTSVWPPLLEHSAFLRYYNSRFLGNRTELLPPVLTPNYYATTCIATGRECVVDVGGFDEAFRHYGCEDEELGMRLDAAGVPLTFSRDAISFCTDEDLTVTRASMRLLDYAGASVPVILSKHPEYARHLKLRFLERPGPGLQKMAAMAVAMLYRPSIARQLLRYLAAHDAHPTFHPSDRLYQLVLLGYYLIGFRQRGQVRR